MAQQKAPRGRPPIGAILVDGKWELTEESIARAAERLEKHRTQCRERYRRNRAALLLKRPDLFKRRKAWITDMQSQLATLPDDANEVMAVR